MIMACQNESYYSYKHLQVFAAIDGCMSSYQIPWKNCVAVGVGNTTVNVEKKNSIMTRVKAQNDSVYFSGCQCHVVHNTSAAAAAALRNATGFDVEDLMVDVYYWFDYSTKRKSLLAEFTEFCDQDYRKILKHVSTRWLSLETSITSVLKQYVSQVIFCFRGTRRTCMVSETKASFY